MCLRQAVLSDLNTVKYVVESTISEVYPHYYPRGAVDFFLKHHSEANIVHDIEQNQVFLCQDAAGNVVGTVTVSGKLSSCQINLSPVDAFTEATKPGSF